MITRGFIVDAIVTRGLLSAPVYGITIGIPVISGIVSFIVCSAKFTVPTYQSELSVQKHSANITQ